MIHLSQKGWEHPRPSRRPWDADRSGYRYTPDDPDTGAPWPAMPAAFIDIAVRAAAEAGFAKYDPDACLINRYVAGAPSIERGSDFQIVE